MLRMVMRFLAAGLLAACAGDVASDSTAVAQDAAQDAAASAHRCDRRPIYLALGDSVPFGWSDAMGQVTDNPHRFKGYPMLLAEELDLPLLDAACPSEASGSFLSSALPDDGCRAYRAEHPLHVAYDGTQLDYALAVVAAHPRVRLVTLQLGANDLQLLMKGCALDPACVAEGLPATVAAAGQHVAAIVVALRTALYSGPIVVLDYYNPTTDPAQGLALGALDVALAQAAQATGAGFVDLCVPFNGVSPLAAPPPGWPVAPCLGADPCASGLIAKVDGACEIHPSRRGHRLIAETVEAYLAAQP
jgi:lysophospholipase L1-like esterase